MIAKRKHPRICTKQRKSLQAEIEHFAQDEILQYLFTKSKVICSAFPATCMHVLPFQTSLKVFKISLLYVLQICKQPNWTTDDYNEEAYNCYTFVLTFLQAVGYSALSKDAENKTYFCEKYIVPRTTTAGKYISLYRKIRDYGLYTHSVGKDMSSHSGSSAAGLRGNFYGVKLCTIKE